VIKFTGWGRPGGAGQRGVAHCLVDLLWVAPLLESAVFASGCLLLDLLAAGFGLLGSCFDFAGTAASAGAGTGLVSAAAGVKLVPGGLRSGREVEARRRVGGFRLFRFCLRSLGCGAFPALATLGRGDLHQSGPAIAARRTDIHRDRHGRLQAVRESARAPCGSRRLLVVIAKAEL